MCLQLILLDRERCARNKDVPETNLVFIKEKKANDHNCLRQKLNPGFLHCMYILKNVRKNY